MNEITKNAIDRFNSSAASLGNQACRAFLGIAGCVGAVGFWKGYSFSIWKTPAGNLKLEAAAFLAHGAILAAVAAGSFLISYTLIKKVANSFPEYQFADVSRDYVERTCRRYVEDCQPIPEIAKGGIKFICYYRAVSWGVAIFKASLDVYWAQMAVSRAGNALKLARMSDPEVQKNFCKAVLSFFDANDVLLAKEWGIIKEFAYVVLASVALHRIFMMLHSIAIWYRAPSLKKEVEILNALQTDNANAVKEILDRNPRFITKLLPYFEIDFFQCAAISARIASLKVVLQLRQPSSEGFNSALLGVRQEIEKHRQNGEEARVKRLEEVHHLLERAAVAAAVAPYWNASSNRPEQNRISLDSLPESAVKRLVTNQLFDPNLSRLINSYV